MKWTKENLLKALSNVKIYNMPDDYISGGVFVTPVNAGDNMICALRKDDENAGLSLAFFETVKDKFQIPAIMCTDYETFKHINLPIIEVENISQALYQMAGFVRDSYNGKVVAITGSAGKSTTTGICYEALKRYGADGNINKANTVFGLSWNMTDYDISVPYWVNEVSLNKGMYPSARLVRPDVAVITNVAPVHLKTNETLETVAQIKSRIFTDMSEGSFAVLNKDMDYFEVAFSAAKAKGLNILTFGQSENANIKVFVNESSCGLIIAGQVVEISKLPLPLHILLDMAAVVCVFAALGLSVNDDLLNVFKSFKPLVGRGTISRLKLDENRSVLVMDESYNANPLSMKMTLDGFNSLYGNKENKILILGDMSEGGIDTLNQHKNLAQIVLDIAPSKVFLVGQYMTVLYYALKEKLDVCYYSGVDALLENITSHIPDDSYIFVKGSHSVGLDKVIEKFKGN